MNRKAIVVLAAALALAGCSGQDDQREGSGPTSPLQRASEGLCKAQLRAAAGDVLGAADVFQAETHDYLHELARILQERDSAAAGPMLEIKQRLEEVLRFPARVDPSQVLDLLLSLQRAFIDAAEAAGLPRPLCRAGAV